MQRNLVDSGTEADINARCFFKEIAEIIGVSINTALGRMRYALLNMRKIAEEKQIVLEMY